MDLSNSIYARELWEEKILPKWRHRDRHTGQRFLGSLKINQENSNRLLNIVGKSLRLHLSYGRSLTYSSLSQHFDINKNWIRIITAALSEYAYYYSSSKHGFWEGFCNHELINISYDREVEIAFREVIREGITLLGLVRARLGHKFVSTLWLQSGIPQRNLHHFAELVQEIANEYGWWELAHTSEKLLSQELLEFCQESYPPKNILINFLNVSHSDSDIDAGEPISGQLVQGIAMVALELERNNRSPNILRDVNQREEILGNYYLPEHFFLRDWDNLIQVLTNVRNQGRSYSRTIRPRKKSLLLILDVFESGNIQLVLPEQNLKESNWSSLLGSYCHIPSPRSGSIWQGNIPHSCSEFLEIPEQIFNVQTVEPQWSLRLLSHVNSELFAWQYGGITEAFPCLVFDANSGTHISLDAANPVISKTNEVICFVRNDLQLTFTDGIYILNSYLPCSISGWYGQHIQLLSQQADFSLTISEQTSPVLIRWQISNNQHPELRGLKIKGRKEVFIETPTFWHPPTRENVNFKISVENLTNREIIPTTSVDVSMSNRWQNISLEDLIATSGKYQVRLWNEVQRYSYSFELKSTHLISEALNPNTLQISRGQGEIVENLPIQCNQPDQFWSEIIKIQGLWTLEKVLLTLSNGESNASCLVSADKFGGLEISLSMLYGRLPESDWYALDYQRSGMESQRLIEFSASTLSISCIFMNNSIQLSGLQINQHYSLMCWNLLTPENAPERITVHNDGQDIEVPLSLSAGIYHIQIQGRSLQDLGCWCGIDRTNLLVEDEDLEVYWYTILDNEPIKDFISASEEMGIDLQRIKSMLSSLESNSYLFPDWLTRDSLLEKLEAFLQTSISSIDSIPVVASDISIDISQPPSQQSNQSIVTVDGSPIGRWYLVQIQNGNQDVFCIQLNHICQQNNLQDLILEVEIPIFLCYSNYILVRLSEYQRGLEYLPQIVGFLRIEQQPQSLDVVNTMMGRG